MLFARLIPCPVTMNAQIYMDQEICCQQGINELHLKGIGSIPTAYQVKGKNSPNPSKEDTQ